MTVLALLLLFAAPFVRQTAGSDFLPHNNFRFSLGTEHRPRRLSDFNFDSSQVNIGNVDLQNAQSTVGQGEMAPLLVADRLIDGNKLESIDGFIWRDATSGAASDAASIFQDELPGFVPPNRSQSPKTIEFNTKDASHIEIEAVQLALSAAYNSVNGVPIEFDVCDKSKGYLVELPAVRMDVTVESLGVTLLGVESIVGRVNASVRYEKLLGDYFHVENGNQLTSSYTFHLSTADHRVLVRASIQVAQVDDAIRVSVDSPAAPLALVGKCRLPGRPVGPVSDLPSTHPRLLNRGDDQAIALMLNRCSPNDAYVEALHPSNGDMEYQLMDPAGKLTIDPQSGQVSALVDSSTLIGQAHMVSVVVRDQLGLSDNAQLHVRVVEEPVGCSA